MNFFRMRILNTFLVLLIGAMLGYMLRGGAQGKAAANEKPRIDARVIAASEPGQNNFPEFSDDLSSAAADSVSGDGSEKDDFELPVKLPVRHVKEQNSEDDKLIEPEAEDAANDNTENVVRGADDDFFSDPKRFAGEDLEMELQMLTAAKKQRGWLISLARIKSGKNADYVYIEDNSVLGEKPDLKIGYIYKTRFRCRRGDASSGNTLLYIAPTGGKAAWATGVSAIE